MLNRHLDFSNTIETTQIGDKAYKLMCADVMEEGRVDLIIGVLAYNEGATTIRRTGHIDGNGQLVVQINNHIVNVGLNYGTITVVRPVRSRKM